MYFLCSALRRVHFTSPRVFHFGQNSVGGGQVQSNAIQLWSHFEYRTVQYLPHGTVQYSTVLYCTPYQGDNALIDRTVYSCTRDH